MDWLLYLVLGLSATWAVYVGYLRLAVKTAEGRSTEDLREVLPSLDTGPEATLVYCYSPQCGPCKAMTREVEALQSESPRVFKLDISQHLDLADKIGIRVTPTILVVRRGQIERCVMGARKRDYLRSLLHN
jgi:thioredoxin-like negative regulator of GroEL